MTENEREGIFAALYTREDALGEVDAAAGQLETLVQLAAGFQFREAGIIEHLQRIGAYVELLARFCGWSSRSACLLQHAALLHDVGMVDVPDPVLHKEGKLDESETALVRRHPELGRALLGRTDTPLLREAAVLAWTHHEAFDGSGYPRGIKGPAIPMGTRILTLADVLDALTTRRTFKDAYPFGVAAEIVRSGAGKHFDPEVVGAFLEHGDEFEQIAVRLATPELPSSTGFRISARDTNEGAFFTAAGEAYFSCPFCSELHPRATEFCPIAHYPLREIHKLSGRVLQDKYHVRVARGVGGMGTVYEAQHLLIGRKLAIKFLDAEMARDPHNVRRFQNEARVFSTVGHPNLVEVTDMGETPEGIPYMVMELLEGRSLAALLHEGQPLPESAALSVTIEVLRTLDAVHAKGVVHRDLKPENIFLTGDLAAPRLKVLDFGLSLLASRDERRKRLTQAGDIFGTPQYMAPEQAQGRLDVDHRTDLFTVGEILYEMLTGRPVFDGPNQLAVIASVALCEVVPPRSLLETIDLDLERAILKALERDPRDRFQSAAEFLAPLLEVAHRTPAFRDGCIVGFDTAAAEFTAPLGDGEDARPTVRQDSLPDAALRASARRTHRCDGQPNP
jgi:hypothetical protein